MCYVQILLLQTLILLNTNNNTIIPNNITNTNTQSNINTNTTNNNHYRST